MHYRMGPTNKSDFGDAGLRFTSALVIDFWCDAAGSPAG